MKARRGIAALACAAAMVCAWASTAAARPGGGQSFGGSRSSGSDSGSSSGSSWSSGGSRSGGSSWSSSSDRKSSDSSWSFGSSRKTDVTPSAPGYAPPSYSDADLRRMEEANDRTDCMLECLRALDLEASTRQTCETECISKKEAARAARREAEQRAALPTYDRSDRGMSAAFFLPVVLLGGVVGVVSIAGWMRRRRERAWASEAGVVDAETLLSTTYRTRPAEKHYPSITAAMQAVSSRDDAFSWILFEDFVHTLYVEAHTARGAGTLDRLAPYLSAAAIDVLRSRDGVAVSTIIVGGLRVTEVRVDQAARTIVALVAFTSNYTETSSDHAQSYYVEETWRLTRDADLPSRPPERVRVVDCPSCGAPLEKVVAGKCSHCNTVTSAGSHDWQVDAIRVDAREPRGPMLIGTTEEVGTDLPTVVAPDVEKRFGALVARDPSLTWLGFTQRVERIFATFHATWSAQQLDGVRPFLSDNLFETQRYWVRAYQSEGLRNVTEGARIAAIHLSRVTSDRYYDALTVRVYASCRDYTENAQGKLMGGSRDEVRQYSEYWTFVRSADRTGAPRVDDGCPNCGAPVTEINMAGTCTHCSVKITSGAFDWVLSRIEQDEVYALG